MLKQLPVIFAFRALAGSPAFMLAAEAATTHRCRQPVGWLMKVGDARQGGDGANAVVLLVHARDACVRHSNPA